MTIRHGIFAVLLALASSSVFALDAAGEQELARLQERWAQINYELPEARREAAFEQLASQAEAATRRNPDSAELKSWQGIILSTWAGAKGGLGALGLAKRARTAFEESLALDPQALDGSAYTSLATLYYQVPGWPIGFGDKAKAAELFDQALRLNPNGLDSNYFHADFLFREGHYREARAALEKALAAPDRPDRALADAGRREEAQRLLQRVEEELE